jgi:hypothetical protein|tara:strand:- start:587 stop:883 length:297 start_codon:yes stop_codon:yes gene_type:complete
MQLLLNHATRRYRRLYFLIGAILSLSAVSIYALSWVPVRYGIENHIAALAMTTAANFFMFKACLELSAQWKTSVIAIVLFTNFFIISSVLIAALSLYK